MIAVRVLGPLDVTVHGAPADIGGPRQRCVLARLVAGHGQVVSADRLIEDLYADEAPPRALAAVQSYVSHLRRALEPDRAARAPSGVLVTSPPGYAIQLGQAAVDAWSFEDEVRQAAALDDPAAAHGRLTTALACWRGPAFQEFGGLAWADLEASRLDELRLMATEWQAAAALRLGQAAQTVAALDRLTTEQPLREEAWRLLALALYQSGRQGDALAALRRARARLAADLGVDPGPALRALEEDILAQAPQLSARPSPAPPVPAVPVPAGGDLIAAGGDLVPAGGDLVPAAAPPYLGRDTELDEVTRCAREAAAGRLRIVLVTGDAGAGKTALADQVSQRLAAAGWAVTAGRCPEHEGAPAGWPWAEALRRLTAVGPPAEPAPLAPLLTDAPAAGGDVTAARFRLHRAVAGYLDEVSRAAPLLVVLDDLHRADGETLAILADVAADRPAARILLLGGYRPAEVTGPLADCLAGLAAREPARIALSGLDVAATGQLIVATCARPVDAETAMAIAERTGGNPFFIRETARLLDSEGALAATTSVPAGVRAVLQRRIARLPAIAQTILGQAAVLGTETGVDVLADVAGAGEDVLLDAVEAGLLTGLLTEPAPGRIRFAHDLVRDTLYQGLSQLRRARLHGRAAAAIERHHPAEVAALAHHYAAAGTDPGAAARYSRLAAEQAEQRFAYRAAVQLWEQAIGCLDQAGDAPARDRLELVLGLVRALALAGQLPQARSYRQDAVRAALPLGDPVLLARVITAFDVPRVWFSREDGRADQELVAIVEQTLARLPPGQEKLRCRLLTTLAFELEGADTERGYQASAEAVQLARRLGDPVLRTIAINGRATQTFRHDGLAERQALGAELLALPGKPVTAEALAHLILMAASSGAADFAAADRHASQAAQLADRYDVPTAGAAISMYRALRASVDGDLTTAMERYQEAAATMTRLGLARAGAGVSLVGRFAVLVTQDRVGEMTADLERVYNVPGAGAVVGEMYALALAAAGRTAEARAVAGPPQPIDRDVVWLFLTGVRGLAAVALDDRTRADSAYQDLLPYADRPAGADNVVLTLGPAAQILGDIARHFGRPGAQAHYEQALAVAERAGVALWRAAALRGQAALRG